MTTSKGTIQGYNGVATVDKKHQVIVDAQAFGEGQEHHVLQPVLEAVDERFERLGISDSVYQDGTAVTADTGYANEANMEYLHKNKINGYIPDNQNEDVGRPAYDPAILLKIILFAYSKGITSSREIQWCCETNIIFKALSCDTVPHYTTLASFVSGRGDEIEALFEQVLLICDEQGLLGKELFAIDGCKMSSNAAKEWSGTLKELEQKRDKIQRQIRYLLEKHQQLDRVESREDAREQRTKQTIETLNQAYQTASKHGRVFTLTPVAV